jgi:hypothetical protein
MNSPSIEVKPFHTVYPGTSKLYHVYCSLCPDFGFCGEMEQAHDAALAHGTSHSLRKASNE